MNGYIDSRSKATIFSTLNISSRYWQIEIQHNDKNKAALTLHLELYRFERVRFGLSNAPGTCQSTMGVILFTIKWQSTVVYLEDIVIFNNRPVQHVEHARKV